jgi:hypothetical protein
VPYDDAAADCSVASAAVDNGSYDPNGDPVTMTQTPPGPYGVGETVVTLNVTDDSGASDACTATVSVTDEVPPDIDVSVSPDVLWPPNHKMTAIVPSITVTDTCDESATATLLTVTMNEGDETNTYDPMYDSTLGDGNTVNDIQIDQDDNISLRAERSGTGTDRIYSITYEAADAAGNTATATTIVTVPHNQ